MKYLTDYLPIKNPLNNIPDNPDVFYNNIIHKLIKDIVIINNNGINIDINKVRELEYKVDAELEDNYEKLYSNKIFKEFIYSKNNIKKETIKFDTTKQSHLNYLVDSIIENMINKNIITKDYRRLDNTNWTNDKIRNIYNLTNNIYLGLILNNDYNNSILSKFKLQAINKLQDDKYINKCKIIDCRLKNKQNRLFNIKSKKDIEELKQFIGKYNDRNT